MSFLAPLFALGVLAVALPVIFHLIRRTTREHTVFSSLMFLLPTPPRVTRKSRLDNILLLLLRCAVIGLLALGFSRPFIKRPMALEPDAAGTTKIVLLLDTSASMSREDLWEQAVARAQATLNNATPADLVAVYAFDQRLRAVMSFGEWTAASPGDRRAQAARRIEALKPGWRATALGAALTGAAELFDEADRKEHLPGVRRIVLITDLQEGSRLDGLQGFDWPPGSEVVVETVTPRRPTNAGLQLLTLSEDAAEESADALRIRLVNAGDSKRDQFKVRWGASQEMDVYVPAGQARTLSIPDAGTNATRVTLEGDDADFDNVLHLVPHAPHEMKLLFLGEDPPNDPRQGLFYFVRALQDTPRQKVRVVARSSVEPLAAEDLAEVQLVVISDVLPEARLGLIREFLRQGKTALLVMKTPAAAGTLARLTETGTLTTVEAPVGNYAMLGQIDFQHPLFAPFADPRFSDFTKIHVWKHRQLDLTPLPQARVLARFDNPRSDPAVAEIPARAGTVLVLTFGWFPTDSQLALSTKFVPLLYSILDRSGAVKAQTGQYQVGDVVALSTSEAAVVRKPDGSEARTEADGRFAQTDLPGLYSIGTTPAAGQFAVNVRPEESRTAPLPVETLEKLGVPMQTANTETPAKAAQAAQRQRDLQAAELESRQKIWRWLILAALMVLMMETWLAGRLTRRAALTEANA